MEDITLVDLLRHGACEGGEIFRGTTDVPLSETGWRQMHAAVAGKAGWQRVICSPLQRCRDFAEAQAEQLGVPFVVQEQWREIDFGSWEGRQISEVWKTDREAIAQYFRDPGSVTPEGGENMLDARERLAGAWQSLLRQYRNEHLLVVQHGGTIRLLLGHLLNMPMASITQFEVPYASITRIKVFHTSEGDRSTLVSHIPPL